MSEPEAEFRVRDGFMFAGVALALIALGFVFVVTMGAWKWFVRTSAPAVLNWPGGAWGFGVACGLLVVFGSLGAWRFLERPRGESLPARAGRMAGLTVCVGAAFGAVLYIVASLPGRNCPSYRDGCEYLPGTGSALVTCLGTAALVGYAVYRVGSVRAERRQARERERLRKLRKKGKGKSRAARRG
jgi:hypothetical protein